APAGADRPGRDPPAVRADRAPPLPVPGDRPGHLPAVRGEDRPPAGRRKWAVAPVAESRALRPSTFRFQMFTLVSMTGLHPYLMFDGDCAEAMRFYEKTLGGKLSMMNHAESPMKDQMPPGMAERIMHARLELPDGGIIMASDWMVGQPYPGKNGFS